MTRRGLTLLLAVLAAMAAGVAGAAAWFSSGADGEIAVSAVEPADLTGFVSQHSQTTNPSGLTGYATQFVNGRETTTLAATGSNGTLRAQLGRSLSWTTRVRSFTVHIDGTLPAYAGTVTVAVQSLDGTIPWTAPSQTAGAGTKLTSRIARIASPAPTPATSATGGAGDRFSVDLLPMTTSADADAMWNATVRVTASAPGGTTVTRDVQVLWCNKGGSAANCA